VHVPSVGDNDDVEEAEENVADDTVDDDEEAVEE
jgi:hypothetical protein